ncbi:hypothetical protein POL68_21710 [Stigmatella sp. ncwal1]|uniref:Lipoprotein n=1 Tax=Stigmatella ashevillensis TaxID=2995309 RepID=A0ABT5DBT9_9BACT|nr:hypothetical protein [Stigmatella ashevillena]MDC0711101.1 hypothetical protein [Stigmatella ashevillena]
MTLSTACAPQRVVRFDTGQGLPWDYQPPSSNKSAKVSADAFEEALGQWVLHAPLNLRSPSHGWLLRTSYSSNDADTRWQRLMSKSFGGLCQKDQRESHCLSPLDDVMSLSPHGKLGLALSLSLTPMRESISRAVKDSLSPQLFYTVITTSLIAWAVLAANPEPVFTKAAAIVSALLLIYLGVETFLEVVDATRELKRATDKASTPEELEKASKRFADRVGPEITRTAITAATVALTHGMARGTTWIASQLSMLPSLAEATAVGASQVGIHLANVGQVRAVAVVGNTLVISLPATAVAMSVQDEDGGSRGNAARQHGHERQPSSQTTDTRALVETIETLLKPGGRLIGEAGSGPQVRIVKGSMHEAQDFFSRLSARGTLMQGTTYPGTLMRLHTGGTVGLRPVSTSGPPTIDVRIPGIGIREIKFIP